MPSNTKILILILLLLLGGVAAFAVWSVGAVAGMLLLAFLLSFILTPPVDGLEGMGMPRGLAAVIVFTAALGLTAVVVYELSPMVYAQLAALKERVSLGEVRGAISDVERFLRKNLSFLGVRRVKVGTEVEHGVATLVSNIFGLASGLVGVVLFVVMTLISTFFLLKDGPRLKKAAIEVVPNQFFEMALRIMHKIDWSLGAYLRGILMDATIIGVLSAGAMWMIDLPNWMLIGLVAMLANMVPYLGPPTAALAAATVSVINTGNFEQVPLIAFIFAVIRLVDDSIIQPVTISSSVRLHPLTVLTVILMGGMLFGIFGMLFAVPVCGVMKVILSEIWDGMKRYRAMPVPPDSARR